MVSIERLLELGGRDVTEVSVEALGFMPAHPSASRELEVLDRLPRAGTGGPADESPRVIPVDGLGEGIVIAVADGADPREPLAVANRRELDVN